MIAGRVWRRGGGCSRSATSGLSHRGGRWLGGGLHSVHYARWLFDSAMGDEQYPSSRPQPRFRNHGTLNCETTTITVLILSYSGSDIKIRDQRSLLVRTDVCTAYPRRHTCDPRPELVSRQTGQPVRGHARSAAWHPGRPSSTVPGRTRRGDRTGSAPRAPLA